MSIYRKIKRAKKRADRLEKRAVKKKMKGKDERTAKLEAKAAGQRGKAIGLVASKPAMMGAIFGLSGPSEVKKP